MKKTMLGFVAMLMIGLILTPVYAEPQEKPDLVVDIDASYDNGYIVVNGLMKNQGKADVMSALFVNVEVETPSGLKYTMRAGNLYAIIVPGESRGFGFRFLAIEHGVYKLKATVDPENLVEESSENNNSKTKAVNVK